MHACLSIALALSLSTLSLVAGCDTSSSDEAPAAAHDSGTADAAEPPEPSPIDDLTPRQWNWVPVDGMRCRDGSATGLGVNPVPGATHLVIFLDGGGACLNAATCGMNPAKHDADSFARFTAGPRAVAGIFNRDHDSNPVRDSSFVYVPYCTGDIHAGNNPEGVVPGVEGTQQFVGYENVHQMLRFAVPAFGAIESVLLTGQSAGGFGSTLNYVQVARAFAPIRVHHLNDSGPMVPPPHLAKCLSNVSRPGWKFDRVVQDCGEECADVLLYGFQKHVVESYPDAAFGLLSSTADTEVRLFFGLGIDDCAPTSLGKSLTPEQFKDGLLSLRSSLSSHENFGTFMFESQEHTTLTTDAAFYARESAGMKLTDWIGALSATGRVAHVGP